MNIGDRVKFPFNGTSRDGTVVRLCEKVVWLRTDFPGHPGKLVRRKIHALEGGAAAESGGAGLGARLRRKLSALAGKGESKEAPKEEKKAE